MDICVVLPSGAHDPAALVEAVRRHQPGASIWATWSGEPARRPVASGWRWADLDLDETTGAGWARLLASLPARSYEWCRAAIAVGRLLDSGTEHVVTLRAGSIGIVGPVDDWRSDGVTAIAHAATLPGDDGLAPSVADLVTHGRWSANVLGIAHGCRPVLDRLARLTVAGGSEASIRQVLQHALATTTVRSPASGIAIGWDVWRPDATLIDIDAISDVAPWSFDFDGGRPRHPLSSTPEAAEVVALAYSQRVTSSEPVLPGGVVIDDVIRAVAARNLDAWRRGDRELMPDPSHTAFVDWLAAPESPGDAIGRYWLELWARRADLRLAFPEPNAADRSAFRAWARDSWRVEGRSPVVPVVDATRTERWVDADRRPGVNVVGYVAAESGLGDVSRRIYRSLEAARHPVTALNYSRSISPPAADTPPLSDELQGDVNIITVDGDQMRFFEADHGMEVFPGRRNIAYWFWELAVLSPNALASIELVDEIWVATEFVAGAFRDVTDKPVRVVPIPVPEPPRSCVARSDLGLPDGRFVFLVTFDHLSITDRKNPIAAIRAFVDAFPEPTEHGPVLVVKTLNGRRRWVEHEQLVLAAAARPDVSVVDAHYRRDEQMRMIELADALVSLHRSEGLGLHLLEAMWLETPVIATRYSGNLDFMTDDNSLLVDAVLVPVSDLQGYYPSSAMWADPHHDQAVDAMRRLVADPTLGARLAGRALDDMRHQPSLADTGRVIAGLCRETVSTGEEVA